MLRLAGQSLPLLISMDEMHVLRTLRQCDTRGYTLLSMLESVLSDAISEEFCVIFLSTAITTFKPLPSELSETHYIPAPFTEVPFDAHVLADPLLPGRATLTSVGSFEFTAKFGRPL